MDTHWFINVLNWHYTLSKHENLRRYGPYAIPSKINLLSYHVNIYEDLGQYDSLVVPSEIIPWYTKFGGSALNTYWVIVLMSLCGVNYVLNEQKLGQYSPYAIQSKIMSYCSNTYIII